jgi:hypothetical protein
LNLVKHVVELVCLFFLLALARTGSRTFVTASKARANFIHSSCVVSTPGVLNVGAVFVLRTSGFLVEVIQIKVVIIIERFHFGPSTACALNRLGLSGLSRGLLWLGDEVVVK